MNKKMLIKLDWGRLYYIQNHFKRVSTLSNDYQDTIQKFLTDNFSLAEKESITPDVGYLELS